MDRIDPKSAKQAVADKRKRLGEIEKEIAHTVLWNDHDLWKWPRERERLKAEKATLERELAKLEPPQADTWRSSSYFVGSGS